ncbi:translation initiation factor IF-2 [Candidatus Puniceispirillum marinum]|uniref:Translation initiation factor IF-2 n=1 Tax=Puniceispirillum marinum (strain IMCC1322) TaxID=488538 RepID=D5BU76_PUNMI|nr:translation initiation factor IF-2 [Candidatus Puniceispirillum marinum]ADE39823.1 Translation initiation factor 2 [Candidatus Puniceispirillum marinum IMCC1322]
MSDESGKTKKLSLSSGKLTLGNLDAGKMRTGPSVAGRKTVQVEVRRKRAPAAPSRAGQPSAEAVTPPATPETPALSEAPVATPATPAAADDKLTAQERAARVRALQEGMKKPTPAADGDNAAPAVPEGNAPDEAPVAEAAIPPAPEPEVPLDPVEARRAAELAELREIEAGEEERRAFEAKKHADTHARRQEVPERSPAAPAPQMPDPIGEAQQRRRKAADEMAPRRPGASRRDTNNRRQSGKMTINQALSGDESRRQRSLASVKRQREKARMREEQPQVKQVRDVIIPDTISVSELANRMAERTADVVKELMKLGIMATATQTIDGETAELVVSEFGHKVQRVSESDIEIGLTGDDDAEDNLQPRPPVVTVMGHVDHGKTSLLDAIRRTDVAAGESGGITQHIGAYQITTANKNVITFIDTPGHEAFTEMRSRGANITDIVVLVVAADDSVMAQTVEAINHAKAAGCPVIVAVNKCDKPEADPQRVRNDLLQQEIVTEDFGGDVLCVDVSAHTGLGLDKLEEAIMLQSELLELRANPDRNADGVVIESKVERGRGSVATLLVQRGTLRQGDIFVIGAESGRVRALLDDRGQKLKEAGPGQPVEILGLNGTPMAGDNCVVVETEARAREIAEYRTRRNKDHDAARGARGSVEQMLSAIAAGEAEELPVVIKTDVHGSLEAIRVALEKLGTEQVKVRMLSSGVGALSESDISLAAASNAIVIGFNVRAIPQARDLAKRDGVEIRYHSIIYELIDEVKAAMGGLLSPDTQEDFIGYAEIRQVFGVSKVGKVAGCMVTEGVIKRGCKVRLLRDNVVIHEGALKTLKRFKDEVKEVREGFECGMGFENYSDIQEKDMIECFEIREIARTLD